MDMQMAIPIFSILFICSLRMMEMGRRTRIKSVTAEMTVFFVSMYCSADTKEGKHTRPNHVHPDTAVWRPAGIKSPRLVIPIQPTVSPPHQDAVDDHGRVHNHGDDHDGPPRPGPAAGQLRHRQREARFGKREGQLHGRITGQIPRR